MKFTCSVDIEKPLGQVVELFDDPDNLKEWQSGYVGKEHLSGAPEEPGAKSKLFFRTGKREMELIETITEKNLPDIKSGLYEHKHMVNTMTNRFTALGEEKTRYTVDIEYTKFIGFVPKVMALLMPGVFKKQVQKWLDNFKAFAERMA